MTPSRPFASTPPSADAARLQPPVQELAGGVGAILHCSQCGARHEHWGLEAQLSKSIELVRARRMDGAAKDSGTVVQISERTKPAEVRQMAPRFQKAQSGQARFKGGFYGPAGSGKSLTALLMSEGLAQIDGRRIAYVDTERGVDFYAMAIPERTVHPEAFDFDRLVTTSLYEAVEAIEELDSKVYGVVVVDSITALWDAARNAYTGKKTSNGGIPVQAWGDVKRPYKKLISLLLDGDFHAIFCGREGVVMEEDESGDLKVTGARMKAEGETPYEPHVLGRMRPERQPDGTSKVRVMFEKDRSGILAGRMFDWPNFQTIEPLVNYLIGGKQARMGTPEDAAEIDAAKAEQRETQAEAERVALFAHISDSIKNAKDADGLRAAWSLTTGKKTKLGDYLDKLVTIKDTRKAELSQMVGV